MRDCAGKIGVILDSGFFGLARRALSCHFCKSIRSMGSLDRVLGSKAVLYILELSVEALTLKVFLIGLLFVSKLILLHTPQIILPCKGNPGCGDCARCAQEYSYWSPRELFPPEPVGQLMRSNYYKRYHDACDNDERGKRTNPWPCSPGSNAPLCFQFRLIIHCW